MCWPPLRPARLRHERIRRCRVAHLVSAADRWRACHCERVDLTSTHFCTGVGVGRGREVSGRRIETTPSALRKLAATLRPDDRVVLGATVNTWPVADPAAPARRSRVVVPATEDQGRCQREGESDKVDSRVLAGRQLAADYILRSGSLTRARASSSRSLTTPAALVPTAKDSTNRIQAVLRRNMVRVSMTDVFGVTSRNWLAGVELKPSGRAEVDSDLQVLAVMEQEVQCVDDDIAVLVVRDQRVRRLLTIPGVGITTAPADCPRSSVTSPGSSAPAKMGGNFGPSGP